MKLYRTLSTHLSSVKLHTIDLLKLLRIIFRQSRFYLQNSYKFKRTVSNKISKSKSAVLVLHETSHYQHLHMLALAKCLELRGVDVHVLLCDSTSKFCEIRSVRNNSSLTCKACEVNRSITAPMFHLKLKLLSQFVGIGVKNPLLGDEILNVYPNEYIFCGVNLSPIVEDSILRYYYGKLPDPDDPQLSKLVLDAANTAALNVLAARKFCENIQPDFFFSNMANYVQWKPWELTAKLFNVPYHLISLNSFNYNSVLLNRLNQVTSNEPFIRWINSRPNKYSLTTQEDYELSTFMHSRYDMSHPDLASLRHYNPPNYTAQSEFPNDQFLLFPNLFWEGGNNGSQTAFVDCLEWVLETVQICLDLKLPLLVKPHPGEKRNNSRIGIKELIKNEFGSLPSHIKILNADSSLTPYELITPQTVGLLYNGTLGLELLINQVPVICTAMAPYSHLDSCNFPTTKSEYLHLIKNRSELIKPNIQEIRAFAYYYFIKSGIPWTLTNQVFDDTKPDFKFSSILEKSPGKDKYLDHLCNCLIHPESFIPANWS